MTPSERESMLSSAYTKSCVAIQKEEGELESVAYLLRSNTPNIARLVYDRIIRVTPGHVQLFVSHKVYTVLFTVRGAEYGKLLDSALSHFKEASNRALFETFSRNSMSDYLMCKNMGHINLKRLPMDKVNEPTTFTSLHDVLEAEVIEEESEKFEILKDRRFNANSLVDVVADEQVESLVKFICGHSPEWEKALRPCLPAAIMAGLNVINEAAPQCVTFNKSHANDVLDVLNKWSGVVLDAPHSPTLILSGISETTHRANRRMMSRVESTILGSLESNMIEALPWLNEANRRAYIGFKPRVINNEKVDAFIEEIGVNAAAENVDGSVTSLEVLSVHLATHLTQLFKAIQEAKLERAYYDAIPTSTEELKSEIFACPGRWGGRMVHLKNIINNGFETVMDHVPFGENPLADN